ncbi:4-alpha-glucanotransferase [Chitinophaga japonensis]
MHITSLPGPFGIGDIGPAAMEFARLLHNSGQQYWQLLPLNLPGQGESSPYSALSAMAGNVLLISPYMLAADGLLSRKDLLAAALPATDAVDFDQARRVKMHLLDRAYGHFCAGRAAALQAAYHDFCREQAYWLEDFVRYKVLSEWHQGRPWNQWERPYRDGQAAAPGMEAVAEKERWQQFIFDRQWQTLKRYCNKLDIQLLGDLPIYVSYDSADVWAHRDLFRLDRKGNMRAVAGVPPDYFNASGQLWNMPVYNWKALKAQRYTWWIQRLQRNLEWYDLLRLDHFRAFAAYWEVLAGADTAVNGLWKPGPGAGLFRALQRAFPDLPFVAEDLGEIDDAVLALRDKFGLPGMKVLQFAFGDDMPGSPHIPHNYRLPFFVYTGTHDNNTTRGWFREDAAAKDRCRLAQYLGREITEEEAPDVLGRLAYASVAQTAVLPMQDILRLDSSARMNKPAVAAGNWRWRMLPGQFSPEVVARLKAWTIIYNRNRKHDKQDL